MENPRSLSEIDKSKLPRDWGIGLIIGPSGSGKLLLRYGEPCEPSWSKITLLYQSSSVEPVRPASGRKRRIALFGELARFPHGCARSLVCQTASHHARLAREINDDAVIDNFTHVVNRHAAGHVQCGRALYQAAWLQACCVATSCADVVLGYSQIAPAARAAQNHGRDPRAGIKHNPAC